LCFTRDEGETWQRRTVHRSPDPITGIGMDTSTKGIHVAYTTTTGDTTTTLWYLRCNRKGRNCTDPRVITTGNDLVLQDLAAWRRHTLIGYAQDGDLRGIYSGNGGKTWWDPWTLTGYVGTADHWRFAATPEGVHQTFHTQTTSKHRIYYAYGLW
jgi:hypothetical protein